MCHKLFHVKKLYAKELLLLFAILSSVTACIKDETSLREKYPHTLFLPYTVLDENSSEEFRQSVSDLESLLISTQSPEPFVLQGNTLYSDWCKPTPRHNQSFKDLINRLRDESSISRDMAQLYLATGEKKAGDKAIQYLNAWAEGSTLLNGYDLGMDPGKATFTGIEEGYCNRSWNMLLDSVWQAYGLINFSIAYSILIDTPELQRNYTAELDNSRRWLIKEAIPAVNAGLHAWTKFADENPTSRAYQRYRADNHIAWALAGLATAGLALQDKALIDYVYYGEPWDDGISGPYPNSSALINYIPVAINQQGEVFDQAERAKQNKGFFYGNFSLWAMVISATAIDLAGYPSLWAYHKEDSGSIQDALIYYAPYIAGDIPLPDPHENTNPKFFSFIARMAIPHLKLSKSEKASLVAAANAIERPERISQSPGHIGLVTQKPVL